MRKALIILLIGTYVFLSIFSATKESLTYDENVHIRVGVDAWTKRIFTADPFSPPLIGMIASLPQVVGLSNLVNPHTPAQEMFLSRMIIVLLSLILVFSIYNFVKKRFGQAEALAVSFLFFWEPSILAHNHLVTKDIGFTALFFIAYVQFLDLVETYSRTKWIIWILLFGLMIAAKTSALPFYFISLLLLFICSKKYRTMMKKLYIKLCIGAVLSFFVVWVSYLFTTDVIIKERQDENRVSVKLMAYAKDHHTAILSEALQFGTRVPIPLGTYLASLKNGMLLQRMQGPTFFQGNDYQHVRWYFLPVNLFYKLPLPIIFLIFIFLYLLYTSKSKRPYVPILVPVIGILLFLSFTGVKPYVRYALPMYPFLLIMGGIALVQLLRWKKMLLVFILSFWYVISVMGVFPHFLSYANETVGGPMGKVSKLVDSDIEWGEYLIEFSDTKRMKEYFLISLSYFGTDNGNAYGLMSEHPYGTYKKAEICAFHTIPIVGGGQKTATIISVTNWYYCGYYKDPPYQKEKIKKILFNSQLLFEP